MFAGTKVTAQEATNWLQDSGFGNEDVLQLHVDRFLAAPNESAHMLMAMMCIARCAETPQYIDDIYFAFRQLGASIAGQACNTPKGNRSILKEAVLARREMTEDQFWASNL